MVIVLFICAYAPSWQGWTSASWRFPVSGNWCLCPGRLRWILSVKGPCVLGSLWAWYGFGQLVCKSVVLCSWVFCFNSKNIFICVLILPSLFTSLMIILLYVDLSFFFISSLYFKSYLFILMENNFCHISARIGHRYMCLPQFEPLLPLPSSAYPSMLSQNTSFQCPVLCVKLTLVICFTYGNVCFSAILSNHPTISFSHWVQKSVLYVCVSFAALHVGLSIPSF